MRAQGHRTQVRKEGERGRRGKRSLAWRKDERKEGSQICLGEGLKEGRKEGDEEEGRRGVFSMKRRKKK